MEHIITLAIYIINFFFWKYALRNIAVKFSTSKNYIYYVSTIVCFFLISYTTTLFILIALDISTKLMTNVMFVFALLFFTKSLSPKYFKDEHQKTCKYF
jgi:hypothetical protein